MVEVRIETVPPGSHVMGRKAKHAGVPTYYIRLSLLTHFPTHTTTYTHGMARWTIPLITLSKKLPFCEFRGHDRPCPQDTRTACE